VKVDEFEGNEWMDRQSFTKFLELVKDMLPEGNTLPNQNNEAKKYFV